LSEGKYSMNEAKQELVQIWLTKAQHDLAAARKLASDPNPYLDMAIYHCQQAGEKAIKGFLVFHDQRVEKTHDIEKLIALAIPIEASLSEWKGVGVRLTPYATEFRDPGEILIPEREDFQQALKDANDLYTFVLSLLPEATHPQT